MIAFRHCDPRYPFLWETSDQPSARWHRAGEGPAHYLADTPEGAWAEFLRHEEISDPTELAGIRRAMWAVEIPDDVIEGGTAPEVAPGETIGGLDSHTACQNEARRLRALGWSCLRAPSAALLPGMAGGWMVDRGITEGPARDGTVIVLYGRRPDLVGWSAAHTAQPDPRILSRTRQL